MQPLDSVSEILSRAETATYLHIGLSSLDKIKDLPRIPIGRRIVFRKPDLDKWLDSRTQVRGGQS